jgi:hypothetical protein
MFWPMCSLTCVTTHDVDPAAIIWSYFLCSFMYVLVYLLALDQCICVLPVPVCSTETKAHNQGYTSTYIEPHKKYSQMSTADLHHMSFNTL